MTPRVIFLNRFFYPDHSPTSELLSDLTFTLSFHGRKVTVITSRLRYYDPGRLLPAHDVVRGVEIFRVWTSRQGRHRLLGRIIDYASFYLTSAWQLWRLARSDSIIVAKTDPPLLSVPTAFIAWLRGAKLINWQQDIFPEVAEALGVGGQIGRAGFALLRWPRNWSLRRARCNVVVSQGMAATVSRLGVSPATVRIIPNWSDGERIRPVVHADNPIRAAWGLENSFVVSYAGNLGRAHEIGTLLASMKSLSQHAPASSDDGPAKEIKFLFVGGGALRPVLVEGITKSELTNVELRGYQPRTQLASVLGAADLHLVILNPELEGLIVPSKIYAIAAAGRPAIFIGDPSGEVANVLKDVGFGFTVEPNNVTELTGRIIELARSPQLCRTMGERARAAFEQRWDKTIAVRTWEQLLSELS